VGVSDGRPYYDNPCLASEYAWARGGAREPAFYMNTAEPGPQSTHWTAPGPKPCGGSADDLGCAYNYGWNAAGHAYDYSDAQTGAAGREAWWLDVETSNTWSTNLAANRADIQGMVDSFTAKSLPIGVYSSSSQWTAITGGETLDVSNWVPGAATAAQALSWCTPSHSFTGGHVALVQYPAGSFDGDAAC
jgi:hypothetical protein